MLYFRLLVKKMARKIRNHTVYTRNGHPVTTIQVELAITPQKVKEYLKIN